MGVVMFGKSLTNRFNYYYRLPIENDHFFQYFALRIQQMLNVFDMTVFAFMKVIAAYTRGSLAIAKWKHGLRDGVIFKKALDWNELGA